MMSQLINIEGYLLTYSDFFEKFGIPIPPHEYSIVVDAIPVGFVRLLQGINEKSNSCLRRIS